MTTEVRPSREPRKFDPYRSPESPVSMWMRKDGSGKLLGWSVLRVILFFDAMVVGLIDPADVTMPWVYALLGVPLMLVLETVAAQIPFTEILGAVQAGAGWLISKGAAKAQEALAAAGSSSIETVESHKKTTREIPAPVATSDELPHRWADGDPDEGVI